MHPITIIGHRDTIKGYLSQNQAKTLNYPIKIFILIITLLLLLK